MFETVHIENPKRFRQRSGRGAWYPYYAGFSYDFASSLISSTKLKPSARIVDPWNGSGTTTSAAASSGKTCIGIDLNPVMVIVAKARLLSNHSKSSLVPLAKHIVEIARPAPEEEALSYWFVPSAAKHIRGIEVAIRRSLVDRKLPFAIQDDLDSVSDIASFYYVALFSAVRRLLSRFQTSNPTWLRMPRCKQQRLKPSKHDIDFRFLDAVLTMVEAIAGAPPNLNDLIHQSTVRLGDSQALDIEKGSVDLVLTSPPYCTRIDYGALTLPELAVLGLSPKTAAQKLRRSLMGTCAVTTIDTDFQSEWGSACQRLLERVHSHPSKAACSYYYKQFIQYFRSLSMSLQSISSVLVKGGGACIVVQDSFFKEVHVDLSRIVSEMSAGVGMTTKKVKSFKVKSPLSRANSSHMKYVDSVNLQESVICLLKED